MTNVVEVSPEFQWDVKPLAKKYHTLKQSLNVLQKSLIENPNFGDAYGNGIFKVCMAD